MSENEIELNYHPKKGITNLSDLDKLRATPKFRNNIRGNLKRYIDNGYRKRNIKRICLVGGIAIVLAVSLSAVLFYFLQFKVLSVGILTLVLIITVIVSFVIYRKNQISYLEKAEKNIKKKTRGCCQIFIYVNNKPFRETIGCMGVDLNNNSFIYVSCDQEKLAVEIDKIREEENQKRVDQVLGTVNQQVLVNYLNQQIGGHHQPNRATALVQSGGQTHEITFQRKDLGTQIANPNIQIQNPQFNLNNNNNNIHFAQPNANINFANHSGGDIPYTGQGQIQVVNAQSLPNTYNNPNTNAVGKQDRAQPYYPQGGVQAQPLGAFPSPSLGTVIQKQNTDPFNDIQNQGIKNAYKVSSNQIEDFGEGNKKTGL